MTTDQPMTVEQAATFKRLVEAANELETFQSNLTRAEADLRTAMLTAKLKLLGEPHMTQRRFPPPWIVEEQAACFVVQK